MEYTKKELRELIKKLDDDIYFIIDQVKLGLFNVDLATKQVMERVEQKKRYVEKLKKLDINI